MVTKKTTTGGGGGERRDNTGSDTRRDGGIGCCICIILLFICVCGGLGLAIYNNSIAELEDDEPVDDKVVRFGVRDREMRLKSVLPYLMKGVNNMSLDLAYSTRMFQSLDQKDPRLIEYTRFFHLAPPPVQGYNLKKRPHMTTSARSSVEKDGLFTDKITSWVKCFFSSKREGTFLEIGAKDGENSSDTLYLEKNLGWGGLLIECDPTWLMYLTTKNRKVWITDACVSPETHPVKTRKAIPINWTVSGATPLQVSTVTTWTSIQVQSIPLFSMLAALDLKQVDYVRVNKGLHLELSVFENFPYDRIMLKVIIVQIDLYSEKERANLTEILKSKGYMFIREWYGDNIYAHKKYKDYLPGFISRFFLFGFY